MSIVHCVGACAGRQSRRREERAGRPGVGARRRRLSHPRERRAGRPGVGEWQLGRGRAQYGRLSSQRRSRQQLAMARFHWQVAHPAAGVMEAHLRRPMATFDTMLADYVVYVALPDDAAQEALFGNALVSKQPCRDF
jgi:hypothetical protein